MAFGAFDLLHPGHKSFIKQAKRYGDYLIVIIARDSTVLKVKGKLPKHSEKQRLGAVKGLKLASKAIMGSLIDKYAAIKKYKPDIICLGYDQTHFTKQLKPELKKLKLKAKIIKLKPFRPDKYKTSILKNKVSLREAPLAPGLTQGTKQSPVSWTK
ncbi:adenylyltransferase/cytidyltransferase family protein [Candidatus Falkowbacteria bacterium]|nr:adenylyltransferase/cytidyltransferase family protein [Candidatus Falkowbacteria bacterium]